MTCCRPSYCCPYPVSTVTVNLTELSLADDEAQLLFRQEVFDGDAGEITGAGPYTVTLSATPLSSSAVQLFLNGNLQTVPSVVGSVVTFTPPSGFEMADAIVVVSYAAVL